jgi:hypothetical protein
LTQQTRADAPADVPWQTSPPRTQAEVLARYRNLQQQHQSVRDGLAARQRHALLVLAGVILVIAWQTAASMHGKQPAWPLALSFAAVAGVLLLLVRLQAPMERARRMIVIYDSAIARVDGSEPYAESTGEDAAAPFASAHLYQHDLDITGAKSLFALLSTVRTGIGERGLARYLLLPVAHQESVLRQQAVRELHPRADLRERIALLGASSFQQLSASFFDGWLEEIPPQFHTVFRYLLLLTAALNLLLVLAGLFHRRGWSDLLPDLLAVSAIQTAISLLIRSRVLPLLQGAARLQSQIQLLTEGLDLLRRSAFTSSRMLDLQRRVPAEAVKSLKRLDSFLVVVQQREKELFLIFSLLFAAGSQTAISIAYWKRQHAAAMRGWIDAWAEFETLNALATYAFEHPPDDAEYTWPQLLPAEHSPEFSATSLRHPLLPSAVPNDIFLGELASRFFLISGSNMAGKSTLLRAIGVSAVLAYAGAPVRGAACRLSPLRIGASIALTDSLAESKSKFLAEVERLAAIVEASATAPVLFLVDEIFSGTNSLDRRTAAAAVLGRLLAHHAIGALSTHDLALTSLAADNHGGCNVHMASPDPADPLAFDYILKPGINQHSNALAIIRLLGLEA